MARDMFDRAQTRAKAAVSESSAGQQLRDEITKAMDECIATGSALTEAAKDRRKSLDQRQALLAESRAVLLSCPDTMLEMSSGNDDLIAKLRDQFIAEELEGLRNALEENEHALLESAVREYTI